MKGLIYRELALMKKSLVMTAVVYVMCMIFAAVVILAFDYGNLDRSDTETFEMIRLYSSLILITVAICGPSIGQDKLIIDDYKTRWMGYQYTLPMSEETAAKAKIGLRVIYFVIGMVLALLSEFYVGMISGTGFRPNMLVLIIALGFYAGLGALEIPLAMRFRNEGKVGMIGLAIGSPLIIPAFIVMRKITVETGEKMEAMKAAGEEGPTEFDADAIKIMLEVAQPYLDTFRTILLIFGIPFIALMFFAAYKLTVKELKRREL